MKHLSVREKKKKKSWCFFPKYCKLSCCSLAIVYVGDLSYTGRQQLNKKQKIYGELVHRENNIRKKEESGHIIVLVGLSPFRFCWIIWGACWEKLAALKTPAPTVFSEVGQWLLNPCWLSENPKWKNKLFFQKKMYPASATVPILRTFSLWISLRRCEILTLMASSSSSGTWGMVMGSVSSGPWKVSSVRGMYHLQSYCWFLLCRKGEN